MTDRTEQLYLAASDARQLLYSVQQTVHSTVHSTVLSLQDIRVILLQLTALIKTDT